MKENLNSINIMAIIIIISCLSFYLGYNYTSVFSPRIINQEYNENCSNLSLEDTAECLQTELDDFFFYNESKIGKTLEFKDLKEQGGVCIHSARYFNQRALDLDFYSRIIYFNMNNTALHAVNIISDETGYCIQDMYSHNCWRFK